MGITRMDGNMDTGDLPETGPSLKQGQSETGERADLPNTADELAYVKGLIDEARRSIAKIEKDFPESDIVYIKKSWNMNSCWRIAYVLTGNNSCTRMPSCR